jgi:DNA polymerase elongation subunit (family B)
MKYNILTPKESWVQPKIDEKVIVDFFNGAYEKDIFGKELLGIRAIEVSRKNNDVDIIFCKKFQGDSPRITHKNGLNPFMWSKEWKTSIFFRNNIVKIPLSNVSETHVRLPNGKIREIGDTVKIISTDENSAIVRYDITDFEEWKKLVSEKQKLYGIQKESQITGFDEQGYALFGQSGVNRIDSGFKWKITIKSQRDNPKFSDNPYFEDRIVGSYHNLTTFFKEAGVSLRGTAYIDERRFKEFIEFISKNVDASIDFFVKTYKYRDFFFPYTKDSVDFNALIKIFKAKQASVAYKINKTYINDLIDKTPDVFLKIINSSNADLRSIFNLKIDDKKLMDYIINCFTFDDSLDKKDLKAYLDSTGYCFYYTIDQQVYGLQPLEQYMIQTGRRLFKGIENYEELDTLVIDIETTAQFGKEDYDRAALSPETGRIFQIGIKTTDGYTKLLEANDYDSEKAIIIEAYKIIAEQDPDLTLTFNGEGFDFPFLERRLELLGCVAEEKSQDGSKKSTAVQFIREIIAPYFEKYGNVFPVFLYQKRENSVVKIGNGTEQYTQTKMFGRNICDVMYAVKRAAEQDKSLPNSKLKDNIIHAKLAKKNRVYVSGDSIGKIAAETNPYYFSDEDGSYLLMSKKIQKEKLFDAGKIHDGLSGLYYGNLSKLYVKCSNEFNELPLNLCTNVFTINLHLDVNGKSVAISEVSFDAAKKHLDEQFELLYTKCADFDEIVVPIDGMGWYLRSNKRIWDYFVQKRLEFAENVKDVRNIYKNANFDKYAIVTGSYIIQRYLEDDLEEPYLLDKLYSQATFSLSKWLPTSYEKVATTGNATVWKLILSAWSYLNCAAIPDYEKPRKYTGGLLGMVDSGFHQRIVKIDFSSQYPATFLAHCKRPDIDTTNVYKAVLEYALRSRLMYKDMKNAAKKKGDRANEQLYDKKQLPLKILINSFYGMLGAPDVSPFCHIQSAWHITCASRQNMRHMIEYFGKAGFKIVYFHTDGANFVIPDGIETYQYRGTGKSWLTEKDKHYEGVEAFVAEYNDKFMIGYTGVAIDEYAESCINLAKGNFSSLKKDKDGKYSISHVGGALVNKGKNAYIVDFYDNHIIKAFLNKPEELLDAYYTHISKINNGEILARHITNKKRVSKSYDIHNPVGDYQKGVKEGRYAKQAHMELAVKLNLDVQVGDWIHYINDDDTSGGKDRETVKNVIGHFILNDKDHFDTKVKEFKSKIETSREEFKKEVIKGYEAGYFNFNNKMVHTETTDGTKRVKTSKEDEIDEIDTADKIEFSFRTIKATKKEAERYAIDVVLKSDKLYCSYVPVEKLDSKIKYNPKKYLDLFNKSISNLWIIFHPDVRDKIPSPNKKYKRSANERAYFLDEEIQLVHGYPLDKKEDKQQDINELMIITEDEYEFWELANMSPNSPFDYQDVNIEEMYIFNPKENSYRKGNEPSEGERSIIGKQVLREIGGMVILDPENPPYRFG